MSPSNGANELEPDLSSSEWIQDGSLMDPGLIMDLLTAFSRFALGLNEGVIQQHSGLMFWFCWTS